jgi:ribosomal protein S18 acetylase RimI-like enzyme
MNASRRKPLNRALFILSTLGLRYTLRVVLRNLLYVDHSYLLILNLRSLELRLPRTFDTTLTEIGDDDIAEIMAALPSLDPATRKELVVRLEFYDTGFKHCYVARAQTGELAHLQWLIYPDENDIIRSQFKNRFYALKEKQVMVENAFTFPKYRGLGLVQSVTYELLQKAKAKGSRAAVCYILKSNTESINQFVSLGFKITELLREVKFLRMTKRSLKAQT